MTLRVLLGSGGFRTPQRIERLCSHLQTHFGSVSRVLFLPYALQNQDLYLHTIEERGLNAGYPLDGIHRHADPKAAVLSAEALYVGGGNTFRLLHELYRFDLIDVIRARVHAGVPYLGISAGTNVAGPTIRTTNDMPIVAPPSFDALNLVPFQINPHYYSGASWVKHGDTFVEHFGETRDDRLREFHEMNTTPVVGLWEGGLVECSDSRYVLHEAPARLFRRGEPPLDLSPGEELSGLLR